MRHHIAATIAIALCAGCQRDAGDGVPATGPAGDLQPAATAAAPEPLSAAAPPPLVLRWECDGGAVLTTKYLPRDEAIALGLHEGERKLPRVISGSGEKYQEGPITFWRKGDTASYERAPAAAIGCRLAGG